MSQFASDPRVNEVALEFAKALVARDYVRAESMLMPDLRSNCTKEDLRCEYERMIYRTDWVAEYVGVVGSRDEIPGMDVEDIGYAYVALSGQGLSEAVAVVVSDNGEQVGVRGIEWGRP